MTKSADDRHPEAPSPSAGERPGEAAAAPSGESRPRREFLRRAAAAVVAIPAAVLATSASSLAGSPKKKRPAPSAGSGGPRPEDARVNLGRPLPALYEGSNARIFEQIQADENAHVAFLVNALGSNARPEPIFHGLEQSSIHNFAQVSRNLENTGVGAYLGALPVLAGSSAGLQYVPAAGSIALIEARHAGYLNALIDLVPTENIRGQVVSFETPLTPQEVVALASPFVASLNGGPPLIPPGGLMNPVDVLNFALALEYLERDFYSINIPKFMHLLAR